MPASASLSELYIILQIIKFGISKYLFVIVHGSPVISNTVTYYLSHQLRQIHINYRLSCIFVIRIS